jgi:hypothetical protein
MGIFSSDESELYLDNKADFYQTILRRMDNFNISFDEAKQEIKEIYPHFSTLIDEITAPNKIKIEMSNRLWAELESLMYILPDIKIPEEYKQRQLGVVYHLYEKEFGNNE